MFCDLLALDGLWLFLDYAWPSYCLAAFVGRLDDFLVVDCSDLLLGDQLNSGPLSQRHYVIL